MQRQIYSAYGLRIEAELPCPGLWTLPGDGRAADVTVRMLPEADGSLGELEHGLYEVKPRVFQLHIPDVARYVVEDGSRIEIQPLPGASEDQIRVYLLGSVMGALLYQRGLFPLHGSAVETPWGGMVFVGAQGAGKSTLAAEFHRRGYKLLSDDVCAIEQTAQGMQILPALSQYRLCPDAFERLEGAQAGRFEMDKFVVALGEGHRREPMPLRAVHVLAELPEYAGPDAAPEWEQVRGLQQVQGLIENLYRLNFLQGQSTQRELMQLAATVAQRTEMAVVRRRRDTEKIGALVEYLEQVWAERYAALPVEERVQCAV